MSDLDKDRTLYCGNLPEKASDQLIYELFLQAGPVQRVNIPKDREGKPRSFCFVTFKHECSVPYALELFEGTHLYGRPLTLKPRNGSVHEGTQFQPDPICAPGRDTYQQHGHHRRTQSTPSHTQFQPPKPPLYNQIPINGMYQQQQQQQIPYYPYNGAGHMGLAGSQPQQMYPQYGYSMQQQYQRSIQQQQQQFQNGRGGPRDRDSKRRHDDERDHRSHRDRHQHRSSRH